VISIVIGVTFFVAYRIGISLGHSDKLGPLAAAFLPLGAYLAVGIGLLLRME
jgi:lipopolysaccharide export LptBFGC system permease protein LptF